MFWSGWFKDLKKFKNNYLDYSPGTTSMDKPLLEKEKIVLKK